MKFNIITIFPNLIEGYFTDTILKRARENKIIEINAVNLRDFTTDRHQTVDDTPYGGGAGMVMKPEPMYKALSSLGAIPFKKSNGIERIKKIFNGDIRKKKLTILMSPRGRQFDQRLAEKWSKFSEITIICGRYEGIDQRVVDHMVDEEISIGPYVLAGGELGALCIVEAVSRLIPGVLGNPQSLEEETFNENKVTSDKLQVECDQYTKPADFMGWKVPDVLLSGNHELIKKWRKKTS